jgi:peptidyl-prolyl cis-trans isomerase NIMA-interacting 4
MGKQQQKPAKKSTPGATSDAPSGSLKPANAVQVRHILVDKLGKAEAALARLDAGEPFQTVAAAVSEDKARQGGALGLKRRDELVQPFADAAFALPVGQYTKVPVKTQFGYHIILVEARK